MLFVVVICWVLVSLVVVALCVMASRADAERPADVSVPAGRGFTRRRAQAGSGS